MANTVTYTIVQAGERIDQLAYRLYGDPYKYLLLLSANPTLDLWAPQAGMKIEVPRA